MLLLLLLLLICKLTDSGYNYAQAYNGDTSPEERKLGSVPLLALSIWGVEWLEHMQTELSSKEWISFLNKRGDEMEQRRIGRELK